MISANTIVLGSGFLGAQLKKDFNTLGVSRSGKDGIKADLCSANDYISLPKDKNIIVFAASPDSSSVESYQKVYIEALSLSLAYARKLNKLHKFILISSTGVYGQTNGEYVEENSPCLPNRENAKVIIQAEKLLAESKLPYAIIRFAGIYGPGRNRMIEKAKLGELDLETCTYSNRIHVEDCSRVVSHVAQGYENIYIGVDDSPCDTREVVLWIRKELGLENNFKLKNTNTKGKRCLNLRLIAEDFKFKYPSFKEGYADML